MLKLVIKSMESIIEDKEILEVYLSDIEKAELQPQSVTIRSEYKNPLQLDYNSNGKLTETTYQIKNDALPIVQTLATANQLNTLLSFRIEGIIGKEEYSKHKEMSLSRLASMINIYYQKG